MAKFTPYQARGAIIEPTRASINGIEQAIVWAENYVPRQLLVKMDELCKMMALLNQGYARAMSFGPEDPSQRRPEYAWRVPVRRISGRYYVGWKVRRRGMGSWELYNDSREAYYIEFGINWLGEGRRVRRPIRKLSLRQTLTAMMTTKAYHRIWADIYKAPNARMGSGFYQIIQSPAVNAGLRPSVFTYSQDQTLRTGA